MVEMRDGWLPSGMSKVGRRRVKRNDAFSSRVAAAGRFSFETALTAIMCRLLLSM